MQELNTLKKRKESLFNFLKTYKEDFGILGLVILIFIGFKVRISNLPILKSVATGQYIPGDPDAAAFLRYAKYVLENGSLMKVDLMRYFPLGYNNLDEFNFLSHFIVYLYKFLHFFNSSITLEYVDVIFPAITFGIALIFFYLLVRKLFNFKVALLASAFLAFSPPFLYRTISGVGDKEALGIVFFFAAFYFYLAAVKSNSKYGYFQGLLAGIFTAILGSTWGGVNFVFLIIGGSTLVKVALNNLSKKEFYSYAWWWFSTFILLNIFYPNYYGFSSIALALTSQITLFALISSTINFLISNKNIFDIKQKLNLEKYPIGLLSVGITIILGLLFMISVYGIDFIYDRILNLYIDLTKPFSRNRWALTVAESQQPFINSWFSNFGKYYMWLLLISPIVIVYEKFRNLKKHKWIITGIFAAFIFSFIFSRYSGSSILNGSSNFSLILYIGSLIFFVASLVIYLLYGFYKDREIFESFNNLDKATIFLLVWFVITAIGARSAIRLLFVFVPVTAVLVSYLLMKALDYGLTLKENYLKVAVVAVVGILIFAPFVQGSLVERGKITIDTAKRTGPSFDPQWQVAMEWVKQNTPKDSVFAHWWDYGYWVQTFGERATLSDGGNARGAINHFIGRYLLTGRNRTEALELLKTHNATHLVIVSDEIGKYTAFSSIGSDENYDRYSYIPAFFLNQNEIREERDENGNELTVYPYVGNFVLDEDIIYNGKIYPDGGAGIAAVLVSVRQEGTQIKEIRQPSVILVKNGVQERLPLRCIYLNNQLIEFTTEGSYDGCLRIMPLVNGNNVNNLGAALFLSPNTKNTLFTQLYLFDKSSQNTEEWKGFEKIYDDSINGYGLAYYANYGRMIGPLKIWKTSYDNDIKANPIYLKTEVPNPAVEKV
ncbi:glycosyltransferase family 39 protein [Candidatus Woesearchaeota archaeon]|nr:glycosyltransferase family 39 protein [Candidatus Woesearchaeota archaeon]